MYSIHVMRRNAGKVSTIREKNWFCTKNILNRFDEEGIADDEQGTSSNDSTSILDISRWITITTDTDPKEKTMKKLSSTMGEKWD